MPTFEVGDRVVWTSQSRGYTKQKTGFIVASVPPTVSPRKVQLELLKAYDGRVRGVPALGLSRNHESYFVLVAASGMGNARPRLYWPEVARLSHV